MQRSASFIPKFADRSADEMANVDPRDRINVEVNDQARLGTQVWPQTRSTVLAGLLLGAIGGVALAFGAEWLDDTYHDAGEVERGTGLTVIGAIPHLPPAR